MPSLSHRGIFVFSESNQLCKLEDNIFALNFIFFVEPYYNCFGNLHFRISFWNFYSFIFMSNFVQMGQKFIIVNVTAGVKKSDFQAVFKFDNYFLTWLTRSLERQLFMFPFEFWAKIMRFQDFFNNIWNISIKSYDSSWIIYIFLCIYFFVVADEGVSDNEKSNKIASCVLSPCFYFGLLIYRSGSSATALTPVREINFPTLSGSVSGRESSTPGHSHSRWRDKYTNSWFDVASVAVLGITLFSLLGLHSGVFASSW